MVVTLEGRGTRLWYRGSLTRKDALDGGCRTLERQPCLSCLAGWPTGPTNFFTRLFFFSLPIRGPDFPLFFWRAAEEAQGNGGVGGERAFARCQWKQGFRTQLLRSHRLQLACCSRTEATGPVCEAPCVPACLSVCLSVCLGHLPNSLAPHQTARSHIDTASHSLRPDRPSLPRIWERCPRTPAKV